MEVNASNLELVEVLKELEALELALSKERGISAQLREEKQAAEESHARDVAMLEHMLQQALSENAELRKSTKAPRPEPSKIKTLYEAEEASPVESSSTNCNSVLQGSSFTANSWSSMSSLEQSPQGMDDLPEPRNLPLMA
mmetsp:Transcript_22013/g.39454  ORF Transcript_22013/g.39454 Transcript_22013/m.39454 type:complete len:140 (-) Transcript_22013:106-525(-)